VLTPAEDAPAALLGTPSPSPGTPTATGPAQAVADEVVAGGADEAGVAAGEAATPGRRRSRVVRAVPVALPIAVYVLLACLFFLPGGPFDPHQLPACNCGDYAKMAAFLEWTPWAVLHGHNPFYTNYQDYPAGVNLAVNTTMPFLGILLAPVTLTAGPIASMNILARLALAGAATTSFLTFRRWVRWTPAAAVGGLLFGFSPYMQAHSYGHPNLIFVPLLPLLLLLADEVVVRQRMKPRNAGLLLGLVAAAQYGVSNELLADGALLAAGGIALLAIFNRPAVRARLGYAARASGWALAAFVPLVAYPVWMVLAGPRHLTGPAQSIAGFDKLRADLLGAVEPTWVEVFSLGHIGRTAAHWAGGNVVENAVYLGLPLCLILLAGVIAFRRSAALVFAVGMTALCYFVSLGVTLDVHGTDTGIPLPFRALTHVPLLQSAIAIRFFVFGYLFVGMALAIILDRLHDLPARRRLRPLLATGVAAVALLPLSPRLPIPRVSRQPDAVYGSYPVPTYFTSPDDRAIPAGSIVLTYPYSTEGFNNYGVLWQAVSGERFRLTDGNATVPDANGNGSSASPTMSPPLLQDLLLGAYFGPHSTAAQRTGPIDAAALVVMRSTMRSYGFQVVVADPVGKTPQLAIRTLTEVLGRSPDFVGGVYVWYGVQRDLDAYRPL
jgi:hypothetical protein